MSQVEYKDKLGNKIKVGDFVAYAISRYHSGALHVALVLELTTKAARYSDQEQMAAIKVRIYEQQAIWDGKQMGPTKHTMRHATTDNFSDMIVITTVPTEIAEFLRSGDKTREIGGKKAPSVTDIISGIDNL